MLRLQRAAALGLATLVLLAACSKSPEELKAEKAAVLAQTTGSLLVKSNLATATIEAKPVGGTAGSYTGAVDKPIPALPPGKYTVTATLEHWPSVQAEATVVVGQTTELALNFPSGSLRLDSVPGGATVKFGNAVLGKTPVTIPLLPPGECQLTLEYSGWPAFTAKPLIRENTETAETVRLPHGKLTVHSLPAGAAVVLGKRTVGQTPLVFEHMPAGTHKLVLQAKDFPPFEATVTVKDGEEVKLNPALGAGFPLLDPAALLRAVWVPDDPGRIAPAFDTRTGVYRPKNDIIKNLHRETLYNNWLRKSYRYTGAVKAYDAANGRIEFVDQKSDLARYRVVAQFGPGPRASKEPDAAAIKAGTPFTIYGRLTGAEEPAWPSKVITLEFSAAEFLPAESP